MARASTSGHQRPRKLDTQMSSSVFQGSDLPMSWKMAVILGTTTIMRMPMMRVPTIAMMAG
jgi:hypothetical protein